MKYCFAPMEGLTTGIFRRAHHRLFPGADRYYTPFLSPTSDRRFTARERREVGPEYGLGDMVIPQILTKNGEDFLWCADCLAEMGYREVNLNLGCPSATVTAKGKGSGLLLRPEELERMLDVIFSRAEIPVSVKTRIGYHGPEEWERLFGLLNRYPFAEMILHPRTRKEMYAGAPHREAWLYARDHAAFPVAYNGDLFTPEQIRSFAGEFPEASGVMMGRAAAANPALFRELRGGGTLRKEELLRFHRELYGAYREELGPQNGMRKMKELWSYLICLFGNGADMQKKLARTQSVGQFEGMISQIFQTLELAPDLERLKR